jgi:hypothetical protein
VTAAEALRALRERWWVLVAATLLAAIAAYAYTKLPWVEPRWRSSVVLQATGRLDYGNFLALEKELRPLAEQVMQDSGQIRIDVEDSDPLRAERVSLEIADVYTRQHNAEEQGKLREERVILSTLDRPNRANLIWPLTRFIVPAAALLGLLAAVGVVLGLAYLDDSLRSAADVQTQLGLAVLGSIPRHRAAPRAALAPTPTRIAQPVAPLAAGRKDPNPTP